jgi:hypothetical protein
MQGTRPLPTGSEILSLKTAEGGINHLFPHTKKGDGPIPSPEATAFQPVRAEARWFSVLFPFFTFLAVGSGLVLSLHLFDACLHALGIAGALGFTSGRDFFLLGLLVVGVGERCHDGGCQKKGHAEHTNGLERFHFVTSCSFSGSCFGHTAGP